MFKKGILAIFLFLPVVLPSCKDPDDIFNPDVTYGNVSDIDGNEYRTVAIGSQVWMAENLKVTHYREGTAILHAAESGSWLGQTAGYCWYDNDPKSGKDGQGALYNWPAVQSEKLCPSGWHVPDIEEWRALSDFLILSGQNYDGSLSGNKLAKALAARCNWESGTEPGSPGDNPATNNATGFSAVPTGFRDPTHGWNTFTGTGTCCYWWTSTSYGSGYALHTGLSNAHPALYLDDPVHGVTSTWNYGFSVRCIKDE